MLLMTTGAGAAIAGVFGLLLGSFLNVVAYRLPRGESLVAPALALPAAARPRSSRTTTCPVLSWLLLRGRCRTARTPISARYPLVEAVTGAPVRRWSCSPRAPTRTRCSASRFVLLLVPITLIDLDHRIIPNKLTLARRRRRAGARRCAHRPGRAPRAPDRRPSPPAASCSSPRSRTRAGWAWATSSSPRVMGLFLGRAVGPGDVRRAARRHARRRRVIARKGVEEGRKTAVPFGPFLAFGGVVGLFAGDAIVDWYLDTFALGAHGASSARRSGRSERAGASTSSAPSARSPPRTDPTR